MPAPASSNTPPFRTVPEAAGYLHISQRQMRRVISCGEISVACLGSAMRIHERDMPAYLGSSGKAAEHAQQSMVSH